MRFEESSRRSLAVVLAAALIIGLVNVAKPVHIDDALYLAVARQIVAHPFDPYGGVLNWQHVPEPTYKTSISPPLLSYYFALVIVLAGESSVALHASMIPFVLLLAWSLKRLGDRAGNVGTELALLVIGGPAVVVGLNLMLDVPMTALLTASIVVALRGVEGRGRSGAYLGAGLLAAAAVPTKYTAVVAIPLFVLMAAQRRRVGPIVSALAPLGALAGWQWWSRSLYGASQVGQSLGFLQRFQFEAGLLLVERGLSAAAIVAMTFPLWITTLAAGRFRAASALLATLFAAGGALLLYRKPQAPFETECVFVVASGLGMLMAIDVCLSTLAFFGRRKGDRDMVLWCVWIGGVAVITIPFGPFVAVRTFLPLQPALALLLFRVYPESVLRRWSVVAAIAVSWALSAGLQWADWSWASCYPRTAQHLIAKYPSPERPVYFVGHWGWQYWMERLGAAPLDARTVALPEGTILVRPRQADKQWMHPALAGQLRVVETITVPGVPLRLTTWQRPQGIRFYGGDFGEIPWGFSSAPAEQFYVTEVSPSESGSP